MANRLKTATMTLFFIGFISFNDILMIKAAKIQFFREQTIRE